MVPKTPEIAGKDFCKPGQCRWNSGGAWVHVPPPETPKYRGSVTVSPLLPLTGSEDQCYLQIKQKKTHKAVGFNFFPLVSDLSLFFSVWADLLVPFSFLLISSVSGGCRLLLLVMAAAGGRWKEAAGIERDGAAAGVEAV
jgi:hypothetical protein